MNLRLEIVSESVPSADDGVIAANNSVTASCETGGPAPGTDPRHARWGARTVIEAHDIQRRLLSVEAAFGGVMVIALGLAVGAVLHAISAWRMESISTTDVPGATAVAHSQGFADGHAHAADTRPQHHSSPGRPAVPSTAAASGEPVRQGPIHADTDQ